LINNEHIKCYELQIQVQGSSASLGSKRRLPSWVALYANGQVPLSQYYSMIY